MGICQAQFTGKAQPVRALSYTMCCVAHTSLLAAGEVCLFCSPTCAVLCLQLTCKACTELRIWSPVAQT